MSQRARIRALRCLPLAAALAFAQPGAAHLLVRGEPLSELSATSPAAVIGVVRATTPDGSATTLVVERGVLGGIVAGTLRFAHSGHHPPDYRVGARVLVLLDGAAPPWRSRQSHYDVVELTGSVAEQEALVAAVQAWNELGRVADARERLTALKQLSLANLESPSARVRRESLLDLMHVGGGAMALDAADVARVAELARRPEAAQSFGPGIVLLLAATRTPEASAALARLAESGASPQLRALAARTLERRRAARPNSNVSNGRES